MFDLAAVRLSEFAPKEVGFDCRACRRHATASKWLLQRRFGDITLGEVAKKLARGTSGNPCRSPDHCFARPEELPVQSWASLDDARKGNWTAWLSCARRFEGLKASDSCVGRWQLDLRTLIANLRHDFPLHRLPTKLTCPDCGSSLVAIEWRVPPPQPSLKEEVERLPDGRPIGINEEAVAFNTRLALRQTG